MLSMPPKPAPPFFQISVDAVEVACAPSGHALHDGSGGVAPALAEEQLAPQYTPASHAYAASVRRISIANERSIGELDPMAMRQLANNALAAALGSLAEGVLNYSPGA